MEVFTFDKSVMEYYEACCMALKFSDSVVSASKIHANWQYYLGLVLEPAGWQALWRLPRAFCEELQIRYPTVVYGSVEQVDFKECKAEFKVAAVPDETIDLVMETHFVNLEELWATRNQENDALNVEKTAEALDNYRFFLNHIWQPWDADFDDEAIDFIDTHFLSRAQLYCDMRNQRMSRSTNAKLKLLLAEARLVAAKRDRLENELAEEAMDVAEDKDTKELLRLNMRMKEIKTEFEILENPKMRKVYEESQAATSGESEQAKVQNVVVTKNAPLEEQLEYLSTIRELLGKDERVVTRSSLQDALMKAKSAGDMIIVPHGIQQINYPMTMDDGGMIRGIVDPNSKSIVASEVEDQNLFVCGNYQFQDLTLDCRNVHIGIVVKAGATVTFKNCVIVGEKQASQSQGICVRANGKLIMENCRFEDNATGITGRLGSELFLRNCTFVGCSTGIDVTDTCQITLDGVKFESEPGKFGMILETDKVPQGKMKQIYSSFKDLPEIPLLRLSGTNQGSVCLVKRFLEDSHVILE